jgi:hypothetical protein
MEIPTYIKQEFLNHPTEDGNVPAAMVKVETSRLTVHSGRVFV